MFAVCLSAFWLQQSGRGLGAVPDALAMAFCGKKLTPLTQYAQSLRACPEETAAGAATKCRKFFPMYTVPLNALLEMKKIEPHEVLKARDVLVEFQKDLGHAAFVSHQWIGQLHPDPDFAQMQVLQDALKHAMSQLHQIPQDALTEVVNPMAKPLPTSQLRSKALFLWYDYFSCPQLDRMSKHFMAVSYTHLTLPTKLEV